MMKFFEIEYFSFKHFKFVQISVEFVQILKNATIGPNIRFDTFNMCGVRCCSLVLWWMFVAILYAGPIR